MSHLKLFQKATDAIQAVFSDQTVEYPQILKSLKLLHDQTDILINAIEEIIETKAATSSEKSHAFTAETISGF